MSRTLPGITFQTVPPPLREKLPRMDVAAFVGFAAAGPLHVPVAVEDEVRFAEIFGPDLVLAWDEEAGTPHRAYLGPAVRDFFRNGGRRCWVVRVASAEAEITRFPVPGLVRVPARGGCRTALVQARSEGAWADGLRIGASLMEAALGRAAYGGGVLSVSKVSRERVSPGDLVRAVFREQSLLLFLAVGAVADGGSVWQAAGREFWFATDLAVALPGPAFVAYLDPDGAEVTVAGARWWPPERPPELGGEYRLFVPATEAIPGPGALLRVDPGDGRSRLMTVSHGRPAGYKEKAEAKVPADAGEMILLFGRELLEPLEQSAGRARAGGTVAAQRLTFELRATAGEGRPARLEGLGFARPHARFLGHLPPDRLLWQTDEERGAAKDGSVPGAALWAEAAHPRFPLAAWTGEENGAWAEIEDIYLPLGMGFLPAPESLAGALQTGRPAYRRNGLKAFVPELFADTDLLEYGAQTLESAVFQKRYVLGQALAGMHALWPLEEVTLLSAPDAIHPPWAETPPLPAVSADTVSVVRPARDASASEWETYVAEARARLAQIHRWMLQFSAARGDLLSILALPAGFRELEAVAHARELSALLGGEERALSYGALYHPWLYVRETAASPGLGPPDGAVTGCIAARAIARGAWVAPANETLDGVVALEPGRQEWAPYWEEQINLVRREPEGFTLLSADTLSPDLELQPINVRRLLILLRRLALREGAAMVFDPNDESFRRLVQRRFEAILTDLFTRGAFAGATPEQSFQVVTDSSVNTPGSVDQGRFIVELRVAPSKPLTFLTVRLVQSRGATSSVSEV